MGRPMLKFRFVLIALVLLHLPLRAHRVCASSLHWQSTAGRKVASVVADAVDQRLQSGQAGRIDPSLKFDRSGKLQVRVDVDHLDATTRADLEALGMKVELSN